MFYFCTFSALFALIRGYLGAPIVQSRHDAASQSGTEAHKDKGNATRKRAGAACIAGATRERGKKRSRASDKPTSPQKRGTPPLLQWAGSPSPHHKFAPKNQQKVALGRFEKIFGKIFRGNVSGGKKNPLRYLNGRGVAITNREISNLAMQVTKNKSTT